MEETNYDRKSVGVVENITASKGATESFSADPETAAHLSSEAMSTERRPRYKKTFLQKLSLRDAPRPQLMIHRIKQQLAFVFWPVVFYAGFAYGSNLIWFNVLNATASLIFSEAPYEFQPSIVGVTVRLSPNC